MVVTINFGALIDFSGLFVIVAWSASPHAVLPYPLIARKEGGSSSVLASIQVEFSFVTALVNAVMRVEDVSMESVVG